MPDFVKVPRDSDEYPYAFVRVDTVVAVTSRRGGGSELNLTSNGVVRSSLSAEKVLTLLKTGGVCPSCGYVGNRHGKGCPLGYKREEEEEL